ncbi:contactin, partial [Elysia marginata]
LVWFTSGYRAANGKLMWDADNTEIKTNYFPSQAIRDQREEIPGLNIVKNRIVYVYDSKDTNRTFAWGWSRIMSLGAYICQIDKSDTWKIYQQRRDFSYGTNKDSSQWKMGPNITYHSPTTLFFEIERDVVTPVVLDCQAATENRDAGLYTCEATNEIGSVESNPIELAYRCIIIIVVIVIIFITIIFVIVRIE